jgi:hypothetical protein
MVVIATGARYRWLEVPRTEYFEKVSVYHAASQAEAQLCRGDPVVIAGGGNFAGQAHRRRVEGRTHRRMGTDVQPLPAADLNRPSRAALIASEQISRLELGPFDQRDHLG